MNDLREEPCALRDDWMLEEMLKVAMEDEKAGRETYRACARKARKERDKRKLFAIADEEERHFLGLSGLYRGIYGKAAPKIRNGEPKKVGFRELLRKAIVAEYESVSFYREILCHLCAEEHRAVIRRIMAENQCHGQTLEQMLYV